MAFINLWLKILLILFYWKKIISFSFTFNGSLMDPFSLPIYLSIIFYLFSFSLIWTFCSSLPFAAGVTYCWCMSSTQSNPHFSRTSLTSPCSLPRSFIWKVSSTTKSSKQLSQSNLLLRGTFLFITPFSEAVSMSFLRLFLPTYIRPLSYFISTIPQVPFSLSSSQEALSPQTCVMCPWLLWILLKVWTKS